MEDQICKRDADFTLHQLNDFCLLKLFEYLSFDSVKSLAKISARLKNLSMIRCHKFTFEFHSNIMRTKKGRTFLDDFLLEYGEHIRSWSLTMEYYDDYDYQYQRKGQKMIFKKVGQYCKNLKSLKFKRFYSGVSVVRDCQEAIDCFDNVELLTFHYCDLLEDVKDSYFFHRFRKLKHLRLCFNRSVLYCAGLKIMFQNNPDIESFAAENFGYNDEVHDENNYYENLIKSFNSWELGPKFHKLCLHSTYHTVNMNILLRLAAINLTKLKLDLKTENLDIFLTKMSNKGTLKELELRSMELNGSEFDILQSFKNLELLVLCPVNAYQLDATIIWPRNLKHLLLDHPITEGGLISLIHQLRYLTRLQWEPLKTKRDLYIRHLHGKLQNIAKERFRRPALNITIHPHLAYIVDYQTMKVTLINELMNDYVGVDSREQLNFPLLNDY